MSNINGFINLKLFKSYINTKSLISNGGGNDNFGLILINSPLIN